MPLSPLDRRAFLKYTGLAIGGGALLAACGSDDDSSSGTTPSTSASTAAAPADYGKLTVQLSWIKNVEFAGEYMADSKGFFKDAGFSSVELLAGPTGAEAVVASGKAFAGLSSPAITAPAILGEGGEDGLPLKIIGATFQKNPFCVMSLAEAPIMTAADMKGKRIGVQDPNELVWQALLKANNLTEKDLTRVPVQFDVSALTNKDVDGFLAYVTNEPNALEVEGVKTANFLFADQGLPFYGETIVVTEASIKNEREKVKALLKAEIQGWKAAIADVTGVVKLTVEDYGKDQKLTVEEQTLEMEQQVKLIVSADTDSEGLFIMTEELIKENLASLAKAGIDITADQLFDTTLLAEVYKENPDLK
jgi:ABC-type nitrate/sulfonate/bicarbonate transport system substrate-binding protein